MNFVVKNMDSCEFVNVSVNGVSIRHQPDSASDVNLWAKNHFDDFCSKVGSVPKLAPAKKPLRAANGTLIQVKGFFIATLKSKSASRIARIFVMTDNDKDLPLLSKFDLHHLGYLQLDPDGAFATKRVQSDAELDLSHFQRIGNKAAPEVPTSLYWRGQIQAPHRRFRGKTWITAFCFKGDSMPHTFAKTRSRTTQLLC